MSTSLNATGNILYNTITLDKDSRTLKGSLEPDQDSSSNLGTPTKRFENLYVKNAPSRSTQVISRGTWSPTFQWVQFQWGQQGGTPPPSDTVIVRVIEAKYEKIGNEVYFSVLVSLKLNPNKRFRTPLGSPLKNLPFVPHQRINDLKLGKAPRGVSTNFFGYDFDPDTQVGFLWRNNYDEGLLKFNQKNQKEIGMYNERSSYRNRFSFIKDSGEEDFFFTEGIYKTTDPV